MTTLMTYPLNGSEPPYETAVSARWRKGVSEMLEQRQETLTASLKNCDSTKPRITPKVVCQDYGSCLSLS